MVHGLYSIHPYIIKYMCWLYSSPVRRCRLHAWWNPPFLSGLPLVYLLYLLVQNLQHITPYLTDLTPEKLLQIPELLGFLACIDI